MRKLGLGRAAAIALLGVVHLAALLAGFLAPHDPSVQDRAFPFAPPTSIRWVDETGQFHLRPFVYALSEDPDRVATYAIDPSQIHPLRFAVWQPVDDGQRREARFSLFAVAAPGRLFLLGTDALGRDVFSRLLFGARISLAIGLLAALISLGLGTLLGVLSGYYGGWLDSAIMRLSELFLALPWLYLLFAVRAALPLRLDPSIALVSLVVVIGLVDWARPARLARGLASVARQQDFVLAARGFGATDFYVITRHVLPQVSAVALTQAALLIPQYVLAEVTLTYLGLGAGEPLVSWGSSLASFQQYHVLSTYWWMWAPAVALFVVFLGYYALAEAIRELPWLSSTSTPPSHARVSR